MPALDLNFAANRSLPADYGPTPSFSRASTGTLFNSSGVLTSAAVNVPRFNHVYSGGSWVSRGLLVEEQRTNLSLWSEQFNNAAYSINQATISANQIASPDGATTADSFTASSGTVNPSAYQAITTVTSSVYTFSIYVKKNTHNFVQIVLNGVASGYANFDINSGTVGTVGAGGSATASIVNVGNGWYRCVITYTSASTSGAGYINLIGSSTAGRGATFSASGTESVYIWGQQLELGAFATSYIPTTSASATRSADVCQITGTSFSSFFNANEGSIAAEYDTIYPLSLASSRRLFIFRDAGNSVRLNSEINTPGLYWETVPAGANILGAYSASAYDVVKAGYGYKVNDFAITVNGATASTDTSVSVPTGITLLDIGGMNGSQYLCGHISRLRYYPTRLTNATLQSLST
jgi:hypothetical protein